MKLNLMNYLDETFDVEIDGEVLQIYVEVVTGDEILEVLYKDREGKICRETFDSANFADDPRMMDFDDGEYEVPLDKVEKWMTRGCSYDMSWDEEEVED